MGLSGDIPAHFPNGDASKTFDGMSAADLAQTGTVQIDRVFDKEVDPFCTFDYPMPGAVLVMANVLFRQDVDGEPVHAVGSIGKMMSINDQEPDILLASLSPHYPDGLINPTETLWWQRGAGDFLCSTDGVVDQNHILSSEESLQLARLLVPLLVHTEPLNERDISNLII